MSYFVLRFREFQLLQVLKLQQLKFCHYESLEPNDGLKRVLLSIKLHQTLEDRNETEEKNIKTDISKQFFDDCRLEVKKEIK